MRDPLMDLGIMTDTLETAVTWENLLKVWKAAHEYVARRSKAFMMIHISHVYENGANLYFTFLSPMEKGNEKMISQLFTADWWKPSWSTVAQSRTITVWAGCWGRGWKGTLAGARWNCSGQ